MGKNRRDGEGEWEWWWGYGVRYGEGECRNVEETVWDMVRESVRDGEVGWEKLKEG